jgi:hypothetical protein
VDEADRAGTSRIDDDRRQPPTNVIQLLKQRQRPSQHATPAGNARRRHQHQAPHPPRILQRELCRHQPTKRMPGDIDMLKPCRLEQPPQPRRHLAGPKAAQLRQLDEMEPIAAAQPLHERRPPSPRARQPMHDNEILPSPHHPPRHTTAIHPDVQHLHPVILTAVVILLGPASLMSQSAAPHFR